MRLQLDSPATISFSLLLLIIYLITHQKLPPEVVAVIPAQILPYMNESLFTVKPGLDFQNPLEYITVFSHVLGHADWFHLFGNLSIILLLGGKVEQNYGGLNVIKWIFITACVTGILNMLLMPTTLKGASGIVFMLIILFSMTEMKNGNLPLTALLIFLLYLGQEMYMGLYVADNISRFCHITGGVMGAILGYRFYTRQKSYKRSLVNRLGQA